MKLRFFLQISQWIGEHYNRNTFEMNLSQNHITTYDLIYFQTKHQRRTNNNLRQEDLFPKHITNILIR